MTRQTRMKGPAASAALRSRGGSISAAHAAFVASLVGLGGLAHAELPPEQDLSKRGQLSSHFKIVDPQNPEASVPTDKEKNDDPLEFGYYLQDLLDRAEAAQQFHQLDAVVAYYRAVVKAVPDMAKGWSKLCEAYEAIHMRDKAISACGYALERPGTNLADFQRYISLHLQKDGPLDATEMARVQKVFDHLGKTPSLGVPQQRLICDVAVHNGDVKALEDCTNRLRELQPKDPTTVVYKWTLAMKKGDYREAKRLLGEAKQLPIPPDGVKRMEKVTSQLRFAGWQKWLVPAALLAIVAAVAWRLRRGRVRLAMQ